MPARGSPKVSFRSYSNRFAKPVDLGGLTILLVEDDADSRDVVATSLTPAGAIVRMAASAAEGLESLQRDHVDIILADIAMPEQDGYAFIREVRASPSAMIAQLPAIAITSLAREEDRRNSANAGFQLHLAKPIAPRALATAIARVVQPVHD